MVRCCSALGATLAVLAGPLVIPAGAHPRFAIPPEARQLLVVSSPTDEPPGSVATFRAYQRAGRRSPWRAVLGPWPAETGVDLRLHRHEGDDSTPVGVFAIGATMYGIEPDPGGLHYAYHRLVCGDWWDEDPLSPSYNRFVHVACGRTPAFASGSEALWTETVAYPYLAVIQFNVDPIVGGRRAPGSGIFLHSWIGGATEGCVALHEAQLLEVLRWLRPAAGPVVEIGTDAQVKR